MKGALPPSSIDVFLMVSAHCCSNTRPISVEPVKDNFLTMGFEVIAPPIAVDEPVITLNTPRGTPARSASAASASAENGVADAGFTTMGQPAASAGPAL